MYEKPQYFTPDGYRRASKNPFKSGIPFKEAVQRLAEKDQSLQTGKNDLIDNKNKSLSIKPHVANFLKLKQDVHIKKQSQISDKAAKLIAEAIRGLLKS